MTESQEIIRFAGMTTAVGMGVVFTALFLLSFYMNVFKRVISKLEARSAPIPKEELQNPNGRSAPTPAEEQSRIAAAIGLGLHLDRVKGGVPALIVAAIGTALHIHIRTGSIVASRRNKMHASPVTAGWKLSGWMVHQQARGVQASRPRI